jgi:hypothetical protein
MDTFDLDAEAEVFLTPSLASRHAPLSYRRSDHAADGTDFGAELTIMALTSLRYQVVSSVGPFASAARGQYDRHRAASRGASQRRPPRVPTPRDADTLMIESLA